MVKVLSLKTRFWCPTAQIKRLAWWFLPLFAFLLATSNAFSAPKMEASVDRSTVGMGETFTFTLSFTDCTPSGQVTLPEIPGIRCVGNSVNQQSTFINGQLKSTVRYEYEMRPTREGSIVIPALRTEVDGFSVSSKSVNVTVTKSNLPEGAPKLVMVKIVPPDRPLYLGETVPLEIHCYYQNANNAQAPQINPEGFRLGNVAGPEQANPVSIGGVGYNHAIYRVSLTPIQTGTVKIGPAVWSLTVLLGRPDFFGRFSDGRNESIPSDVPQVEVLPLPQENVPAGFKGAIGSFNLDSYDASPTNLAAGDPITVKVRISGQGSLDLVTLNTDPAQWQDFKTYPATFKTESNDPLQLNGSKYLEQVVTPQNSSVKALPPFSFSFFDPVQKSYRTLEHAAVPLTVRPTAATPQPTVFAKNLPQQDNAAPQQEIVNIKNQIGSVPLAAGRPLIRQTWFIILQIIAPLAWLGSIIWRKGKERLANNPQLRRQRQVARIVRDGLRALPSMARANQTEEFYATVFRLLQEQLGERLNRPSSGITEAVLDELQPQDASEETLSALRELFQICNQSRYAPDYAKQELGSLLPKVEMVMNSLRTIQPANHNATAKSVAGLMLLFAMTVSGYSQNVSTAFREANGLYEQGKYSEAASAYEKLIQQNQPTPSLYFNLGNAYFKAGQTGRAILAYRQAEKLAPRDPDVRANLQFARNHVGTGNTLLPGSRWTRWMNRLTLNEWTILTSVVVAVFFVLLTVRQLSPKAKQGFRSLLLPLGLGSGIMVAALSVVATNTFAKKGAVVITTEATIRRGPFNESPSVFTARDGAELSIIENQNEWFEIIDSANRRGWIKQAEVGIIE